MPGVVTEADLLNYGFRQHRPEITATAVNVVQTYGYGPPPAPAAANDNRPRGPGV
jgi:hypothetical protein